MRGHLNRKFLNLGFAALLAAFLGFAAGCGEQKDPAADPGAGVKETPKATVTSTPEPTPTKRANNGWWWGGDDSSETTTSQGEVVKRTPTPTPTPTTAPAEDSIYAKLGVSQDRKFSTYVFSITGDPADLTLRPNGLFYGENYKLRGRESEKKVFVEAWNPEGKLILSQYAGLRIYGAYSRQNYLKSVKLFARAEYDPEKKNFKYNFFNTPQLDGSDKYIKKYKKLVLRDSGNDYQFAWIRDELNQTLASSAGFTDYEACAPAIYYLNGEYRGFYWLHESYCDSYFKNKYGDEGKNGEFAIVEGNEIYKKLDDDDEATVKAAEEYNKAYIGLINMDLTDDSNFKKLGEFMDVENYLMYYAYNIYICNHDWPNNNYKCYRYYAADGEEYMPGTVYDGRWRFLLHDMDYSMGLYDQKECLAGYDKLGEVLTALKKLSKDEKVEEDEAYKLFVQYLDIPEGYTANIRYAPLFAKLMERADCRDFFVSYSLELAGNALSRKSINETLDVMNEERADEIEEFYKYLEVLRAKNADGIWSWRGHYEMYTDVIRDWAKQRANYSKRYMEKNLKVDLD